MKYEQVTSALRALQVTEEEADRLVGSGTLAQAITEIRSAQPPAPNLALLEWVKDVGVPAVSQFVAAEELTEEKGFWLSNEAKQHLLSIVSQSVPAGRVEINELARGSVDGPIREERSGRIDIPAARWWATLQLGHKVVGEVVIAYLEELPDWTVLAHWNGGKWYLFVCPVTFPDEWPAGFHVLSGDSGI